MVRHKFFLCFGIAKDTPFEKLNLRLSIVLEMMVK